MTDTSTTTADRTYFATQFAHVEWMVYTRGRLSFVLVDDMGRELDGPTARRIAVDYEGTAFHYGEPVEDDATPFAARSGLMTAAQLEVFTTPGCHMCGIPFELEGLKAQQPGTVYCRECTDAEAVDAR